VITFLTQEGHSAGSVWGDIYRNRFLASVRSPPVALTPDENDKFHKSIRVDKLKASCMQSSLIAPEIKKASTEENSSALIPLSLKGL